MRHYRRSRAPKIVGAAVVLGLVALVIYLVTRRDTSAQASRTVVVPASVQRAFQHFSDSVSPRLLDTLFALGYHGGYSWEEKSGPKRPNLIARSEMQSTADSTEGLYEGTFMLDFHHDSLSDVPATIILRFASVHDAPNWVLLTADGNPIDATADLSAEIVRKMPPNLTAALMAPFADKIESYDWWRNQENKVRAAGRRMTP